MRKHGEYMREQGEYIREQGEYMREHSEYMIHNTSIPMTMHPKVMDLTLDQKLTYSTHIHNISVHAH